MKGKKSKSKSLLLLGWSKFVPFFVSWSSYRSSQFRWFICLGRKSCTKTNSTHFQVYLKQKIISKSSKIWIRKKQNILTCTGKKMGVFFSLLNFTQTHWPRKERKSLLEDTMIIPYNLPFLCWEKPKCSSKITWILKKICPKAWLGSWLSKMLNSQRKI